MKQTLGPQEKEVMRLLVEGMKTGEIAAFMGRSTQTIQTHISRAKKKIGGATILQTAVLFDRASR